MPATTAAWASVWWWWLLSVALSWGAIEVASIVVARARGQRIAEVWTLSECIRRWSAAQRWLAPLVVGIMAMLCWHFFGQGNP